MSNDIVSSKTTDTQGVITIANITGGGDDRVNIRFDAYGDKRDITILVLTHEQFSLALTGARQIITSKTIRD